MTSPQAETPHRNQECKCVPVEALKEKRRDQNLSVKAWMHKHFEMQWFVFVFVLSQKESSKRILLVHFQTQNGFSGEQDW